MIEVLYYCIFSVKKHDQHGHRLYVLLREIGVLKLDEVILVVDFETAFLAFESVQQFFMGVLVLLVV